MGKMLPVPKLSKAQFRFFASAFKTISEAVILGSSAAFFLPETLQLKQPILFSRYLGILLIGLFLLFFGAILEKKGEK